MLQVEIVQILYHRQSELDSMGQTREYHQERLWIIIHLMIIQLDGMLDRVRLNNEKEVKQSKNYIYLSSVNYNNGNWYILGE
jgi:hypothetical protein